MRTPVAALALLILVGGATLERDSFDGRFAAADRQRHDQPVAPASGGVPWRVDVQPILQRRGVVCHGCYDAPCRLKLGAWQGVARGASGDYVDDTERLLRVEGGNGGPRHFTLLRSTAHADVAHMAREKSELLPDGNTLTVVPGFIGAYPNTIYRASPSDLPALREAISSVSSEAD